MPTVIARNVTLTRLAERVDVDVRANTPHEHVTRQAVAAVCGAVQWGTLALVERITVNLDGVTYWMRREGLAWRAVSGFSEF